MERIKCLNRYQKGILIFMAAMAFVFAVIYHGVVSRVGFEYWDTILVLEQKNDATIYSGKIEGQRAQFTVSEDRTVVFQYGDKTYGPYTAKEDATAVPKNEELIGQMTGVELREGENVRFRGGVLDAADYILLYDEDGAVEGINIYATANGKMMDADGNEIDPMEPSVSAILTLMGTPELTHKGEWLAWFGGVFICILNALNMLFADELFRWSLSFRIYGAEHAEPSDWEIFTRYVGWAVVSIMAFGIFIWGLWL